MEGVCGATSPTMQKRRWVHRLAASLAPVDDGVIVCRCRDDMSVWLCVCTCVDAYRLRNNSIGPDGAAALATSLGSLTSLQSLSYVVSGGMVRGWCGG